MRRHGRICRVPDHGELTGLDDNDHTQYVNAVSDTSSINLTLTGQSISGVAIPGGIDHGGLAGLLDDDHTQYLIDTDFTQDSGFLVGTGAGTYQEEAGATLRTSIGVGTGDSLTLAGLNIFGTSTPTLTIESSDASDPTLIFKTTNTANQLNLYLDESQAEDYLRIEGQTAGQETVVAIKAQDGQAVTLRLYSGNLQSFISHSASDVLSIKNTVQDRDLILGIRDGAVAKTITWDADVDRLKHSAGLFHFDNDNITTEGTVTSAIFNATDEDNALQIDGTTILRTGTTANQNIFLGNGAFEDADGSNNVGIGTDAGANNDISTGGGEDNLYIGAGAGKGAGTGNKGKENFALGTLALFSNTTGIRNVAIGQNAMIGNTTGGSNVALGRLACWSNASGGGNIGIGENTLRYNQTGEFNTVIGREAGQSTSGNSISYNIFIGKGAGKITTGSSNVFIGYLAGTNQTTLSNLFIIDNQDRGSAAAELTDSLIYGIFNAAPASQSLRFNVGTFILGNPTHSDADGGGAIQQQFIREQSGGEASIAGQIEVSHDGTGDDQLGKIVDSVNTGAGLATVMTRESSLDVFFTKIKLTAIGGYAIKMTNQTDAVSVAGKVVECDHGANDAVELSEANGDHPIGVFLDSGIANGSEVWIVVAGVADVAYKGTESSARGNWVYQSDVAGFAIDAAPTPGHAADHWKEIGHCCETVTYVDTPILARCVLHFN